MRLHLSIRVAQNCESGATWQFRMRSANYQKSWWMRSGSNRRPHRILFASSKIPSSLLLTNYACYFSGQRLSGNSFDEPIVGSVGLSAKGQVTDRLRTPRSKHREFWRLFPKLQSPASVCSCQRKPVQKSTEEQNRFCSQPAFPPRALRLAPSGLIGREQLQRAQERKGCGEKG